MYVNLLHLSAKVNALLSRDRSERVFVTQKTKSRSQKLLWKKHTGILLDIDRYYLQNELKELQQLESLSPWKGKNFVVEIPKLVNKTITSHKLLFSTSFFDGKKLADSEKKLFLPALKDVIGYINYLQRRRIQQEPLLGTRTPKDIYWSGLLYGAQAIVKNPRLAVDCFKMTWDFSIKYSPALSQQIPMVLTHRDIDPDNIMIRGKHLLLADWENAVLSDPLYDLAQVPRLYGRFIGMEEATNFCLEQLESTFDRARWTALSYYGTLQSLAIKPKQTHMFASALACLNTFKEQRVEEPSKSLYERIFYFSYSALEMLYKIFPFANKPISEPMILCYHNVGNDKWRFTTPPDSFKKQLEFLNTKFEITSLSNLLKNRNGVAITFDDGYADLTKYAVPVLKKMKKPATVFMIGNAKEPNREELDNILPLATDTQIKKLISNGWEIGFHTKTHADLAHLSAPELKSEIKDGKRQLEKRLGLKLKFFAYPRGYYSEDVINVVKEAKFKNAFTVDGKPAGSNSDPFLIHRIPLEGQVDDKFLAVYLTETGLWLESLFVKILQLKERYTSTGLA